MANVGLFWNAELFEAAGVRQPAPVWSYADLAEAAARLTRREEGGVASTAWPGTGGR